MKYKVYIKALNNFPIDDNCLSAYLGFKGKIDIIFYEDIEEVPKSKYNIVVGYIDDLSSYMTRMGLSPKMALNIPLELETEEFLGRVVKRMSFGELRKKEFHLPSFIKPDGKSKEFIAGVIETYSTLDWGFSDIGADCPVLISEVVDFESEWRTYVVEDKIVGIKNYKGDEFLVPSKEMVLKMISAYTSAPKSYSLEVGIVTGKQIGRASCRERVLRLV